MSKSGCSFSLGNIIWIIVVFNMFRGCGDDEVKGPVVELVEEVKVAVFTPPVLNPGRTGQEQTQRIKDPPDRWGECPRCKTKVELQSEMTLCPSCMFTIRRSHE